MVKNKRKLQAEKTKDTIVQTINEMILERPISQLTIREICNKAGISPGAFYHHFDSKEAAILYSYRTVDHIFENLKRIGTPLENIHNIISIHLGLMSKENTIAVKSVYISHLLYYDEYFFSESRPIFRVLKEEISAFTEKEQESEDVHKLTWKILRFCRGMIYNACIDGNDKLDNWPLTQANEAVQYFIFEVNRVKM